jgi:hypothetical protein
LFGVQSLWAFFCHVFISEQSAAAIGWDPSPFQFEVGVANLGLGLASLYAAFSGFGARAAIAVLAACFLGGAGVGHVIDIAQGDNLAPGNAGPILYTDFLTPIAVLVLLLLVPRSSGQGVTRSAKVQTAPAKIETSPASVVEKAPQATASSRIEDELETARKSMRESLRAGPGPEVLSPAKPVASNQPRKTRRGGKGPPDAKN